MFIRERFLTNEGGGKIYGVPRPGPEAGGQGLFFEAIFSQNPARVPRKFCPVPYVFNSYSLHSQQVDATV